MKRLLTLSSTVLAMAFAVVRAQDPQFSQFYSAPQYLNPALIGETHQDRVVLNYRLQWPGIQPGYETYMAAYDHRFSKMNAGIGGMVLRDKAGTTGLQRTTVGLGYSYAARINYKRFVRAGLRVGYSMRSVDASNFLFADQLIRDQAPISVEQGLVQRVGYMDLAGGALYHGERFWAGVGLDHLNRPDQSLIDGAEAKLDMRTSVHAGYKMAMDGSPVAKSNTTVTVAAHYKMQGAWDQFDLGGYVEHGALTGGLWYRGLPLVKAYAPGYGNSEAVVLIAGYDTGGGLRVAYSYDVTISSLTMKSGGAHEISLTHEWPQRRKAREPRMVPCPKF